MLQQNDKKLTVRVNADLTLDAGRWEEVPAKNGATQRLVHSPETAVFEQVLDYLDSLPPPRDYPGIHIGQEAVAATAVCLRWGSYLAVLADRDKPLWSQARREGLSRIADGEMARINIEASAALEQWIDVMRDDWDRYLSLMWAARHLPMPQKSVKRDRDYTHLFMLSQPAAANLMPQEGERVEHAQAEAETHPTRVLSNALINACWRNGPVEDIHRGQASTYPLTQRRITPSEERMLMRTTAGRLAQGIYGFSVSPAQHRDLRPWAERVLPYNLASLLLVTPTGWSLDERTRQVWLPGTEQRQRNMEGDQLNAWSGVTLRKPPEPPASSKRQRQRPETHGIVLEQNERT